MYMYNIIMTTATNIRLINFETNSYKYKYPDLNIVSRKIKTREMMRETIKI